MSHVALSGRLVSGSLEPTEGGAFLRGDDPAEWDACGFRLGDVVDADAPDVRGLWLVVGSFVANPAGEPGFWVKLTTAPPVVILPPPPRRRRRVG